MIRTAFALVTTFVFTIICGLMGLVGALFGAKDRPGSIYDWAMYIWGSAISWASGAKVYAHGVENLEIEGGGGSILVCNHMSQHDILVLACVARNLKFVAKRELQKVPFFGKAAASVGTVYIERQNRKSSFDSYKMAAEKIRDGARVAVFAEGSRGQTYSLRPFKKGPFVMATAVNGPIVPVVIHGTREVHPIGTVMVYRGRVDLHFLPAISTAGLTYEDRNEVAKKVYDSMAELLVTEYGIESPQWDPRKLPVGQ